MKKTILSTATGFIALFLLSVNTYAQEPVQGLKQKLDITIDELGNAKIEVSMKLNASDWDNYKRNYGNNTSIIKRNIEKALPKNFLSDFGYSEDPMERTYTVKMKALGLCTLNKNGDWEAKLETKNPDITKLSDNEFLMNEDIFTNGVLMQQTQKVHLPSGTSGAKVVKDSFGSAVLTYSAANGWANKMVKYGGMIMVVAGAGMFFKRYTARAAEKK